MTITTQRIGRVNVQIEGNGDETIVMLHGWPDRLALWDASVAALAPRYRCVRFTLPGFDEAVPHQAATLDEIVQTLHAVVQATSPGRAVTLLLHDWGCAFGYQFAMRHPQCVARIVGVDVGDAGSHAFKRSLSAKALAMVMAYQLWLVAAWRLGGAVGDRMTRRMARWLRCPAPQSAIHAGMCYPYDMQWTGSFGGFKGQLPFKPECPMLYIYGTRKPFMFHSPQFIEHLGARPGCSVVPLRTGHWVMCQQPEAFNQAVLDWLTGH